MFIVEFFKEMIHEQDILDNHPELYETKMTESELIEAIKTGLIQ